jgi:hypothetical protein
LYLVSSIRFAVTIKYTQKMEFRRKFGRKKESKPTKGLFLILLLVVAIILWFKMEAILDSLF